MPDNSSCPRFLLSNLQSWLLSSLYFKEITITCDATNCFQNTSHFRIMETVIMHKAFCKSFHTSVIRQKGKSQNRGNKKAKHAKFSEKRTFLTPWYAYVCVRIRDEKSLFFGKFDGLYLLVTCFKIRPFTLLTTHSEFWLTHLSAHSLKLLQIPPWYFDYTVI